MEREIYSRQVENDRLEAGKRLKRNIEFSKELLKQSTDNLQRQKETELQRADLEAKEARNEESHCDKVLELVRQGKAQYLYSQHPNKLVLEKYHKIV